MQHYAKLLYKTSFKNIEILVLQGDITEKASDAIVNAANEYLAHGGGVAGAIIRKGGYRIQKESDEYISKHGIVNIGEVATTGPGNLKCKFIIHAVGPIYKGGWNNEIHNLSKAVKNSIHKANQLCLKSISIPAISSGIFGFPKPLCADIIVKAAKKSIETETDLTVKEIRLINNDFETALLMKNSVNKIFDSAEPSKAKCETCKETNENFEKNSEDDKQDSQENEKKRGFESKSEDLCKKKIKLSQDIVLNLSENRQNSFSKENFEENLGLSLLHNEESPYKSSENSKNFEERPCKAKEKLENSDLDFSDENQEENTETISIIE